MTVADLTRMIAELGRWPLADVQQRARYLREAGRLPQGGNGINAPHIGPAEAATLLIGLAATDRQTDVVEGLTLYEALVPAERYAVSDGLPRGTFGEAMRALLTNPAAWDRIASVHVDRAFPAATITTTIGWVQHYSVDGQTEPRMRIRDGITFYGGLLDELALELADDDESTSGWLDDPNDPNAARVREAFARHAAEQRTTE